MRLKKSNVPLVLPIKLIKGLPTIVKKKYKAKQQQITGRSYAL